MAITENKNRIGNFTSSEIWKLMKEGKTKGSFGAPALTYIQEKKFERKIKRSLDVEAESKPMKWGKFLESRVHNLLPLSYKHVYDETLMHEIIDCWSGSPDEISIPESTVCDVKCLQPKKFCETVDDLTDAIAKNDISIFRDNHPDKYWQLTSNAIITGMQNIELIVYMPYESELQEIRDSVADYDGDDQWKYRFIAESDKSELAYLPNDSEYKNLNIFRFALDQKDAALLTQTVLRAKVELLKK